MKDWFDFFLKYPFLLPSTVTLGIWAIRLGILSLVITIIICTGCSITHREGRLPKVSIDNPYADDTEVKIKKDSVIVKMEWEL